MISAWFLSAMASTYGLTHHKITQTTDCHVSYMYIRSNSSSFRTQFCQFQGLSYSSCKKQKLLVAFLFIIWISSTRENSNYACQSIVWGLKLWQAEISRELTFISCKNPLHRKYSTLLHKVLETVNPTANSKVMILRCNISIYSLIKDLADHSIMFWYAQVQYTTPLPPRA